MRAVADTAPLYRRAHVFLLTSDCEGTPNVVLEAMASGLPVVASAVGGVPEVVEDGVTGYCVAPEDEPVFVEAVYRLAMERDLRARMGRGARRAVEARWSRDRMPQQLSALYETALRMRKAFPGKPVGSLGPGGGFDEGSDWPRKVRP
ncbi:MAG: glycosyltransferase [Halothiobacillaceae bacterium]